MTAEERAESDFLKWLGESGPLTPEQDRMMRRSGVYQRALLHERLADFGAALRRTAPARIVYSIVEWLASRAVEPPRGEAQ